MVTLADGTASRIDALKEGDSIVATTANGVITTDTVSFVSLAKPEAEATFVSLITEDDMALSLTPEHHVPVGAVCCTELKMAKEVSVGELVWTREADAIAPHAVVGVALAIKKGLHSPVLTGGSFPVVDGVVTSFDSMAGVTLAKVGLTALAALCQATGTCALIRSTFINPEREYINPRPVLAAPFAATELAK
mmetsp:Transcript_24450/g.48976  ORF Transcript_24450/g.48976 Transcript_24450/m.48976 type:complete len:193 (-) Transcript_24450:288-866(-)